MWPRRPNAASSATAPTLWGRYASDALALANAVDLDMQAVHAAGKSAPDFCWRPGRMACNWFFQDVGAVTVGGVMTAFRIADQLRLRGVHQRFLICGQADVQVVAQTVLASFPRLRGSEFIALDSAEKIAAIPAADIGVATLWTTAYVLAKARNCARKMYLIQDFEPLFYPAGSTAAQAELTYRLGLDGICNTEPLRDIYRDRYGGEAIAFTPQLDQGVFHPGPTERRWPRARVFFYARPETPRNAFELSAVALRRLKQQFGSSVEIVCAGAAFDPSIYGLEGVVESLGWLPYERTGELYRTCHVGLSSMLTPHPSYLPFELMACGALVVALRNDANQWLLKDEVTCLISEPTASCLTARLAHAIDAWDDLAPIRSNAARLVAQVSGQGWPAALEGVVDYMCRPSRLETPVAPDRLPTVRTLRVVAPPSPTQSLDERGAG